LKLPDEREQVVIAKLALEYRMMQHGALNVANVPAHLTKEKLVREMKRTQDRMVSHSNKYEMKRACRQDKLVKFFRDPTGFLQ
jgi:hypothetical protein